MGINHRLHTLDFLRGTAIVMMVAFHFCFDLNHFKLVSLDIYQGDFWRYFRFIIVSLFIFVSGYTLVVVHRETIQWRKALNRSGKLLLLSLLISAATYLIFPQTWIYFGVLHFFTVATLLVLPLVRFPWVSLVLGVGLYIGFWVDVVHLHGFFAWVTRFVPLPHHSEDLVSLIPWITPMLVGIFAGHKIALPSISMGWAGEKIALLGRHALLVYMVHQPILFSVTFLAALVFV